MCFGHRKQKLSSPEAKIWFVGLHSIIKNTEFIVRCKYNKLSYRRPHFWLFLIVCQKMRNTGPALGEEVGPKTAILKVWSSVQQHQHYCGAC